MARNDHYERPETPLILIVPGLNNSGSDHWQTHWETDLPGARRVDLGMWAQPHRNTWVNKLNHAIIEAGRPVILVAHSLGCHAVAWWARYERPCFGRPVAGALLVAPPDVESENIDQRLKGFAPLSHGRLPFSSILVASQNDPYASFGQAKRMARKWGSRLVDAGPIGHINVDSGIEDWPYGKYLLSHLIAETAPLRAALLPERSVATLRQHGVELR